MRKRW